MEVVYRVVSYGKESELECAIICANFPLEIEVRKGMCEAHSDCTHASPHPV